MEGETYLHLRGCGYPGDWFRSSLFNFKQLTASSGAAAYPWSTRTENSDEGELWSTHANFVEGLIEDEAFPRATCLKRTQRHLPRPEGFANLLKNEAGYTKDLAKAKRLGDNSLVYIIMASSEVDTKFLGSFAKNLAGDSPFLASQLYQLLGNLTMLSPMVIKARKERRLDPTRHTKSIDLYCRIIWYARNGLTILEQYVLPMVTQYSELRCLAHKLRASYYHLYVLFHNSPPISLKAAQLHTPPGLTSPRERVAKLDKGKGVDRGSPVDPFRPSSVQPTHPLEGGPVGGAGLISTPPPPVEFAPDFLVPAADYRSIALQYFTEACTLGETRLWGSHPLYLSARVEMCAFLYDCMHEAERSRAMAKKTIAEVYNAKEGMDDDMFEDSAELVGILGRMMKRGLGSSGSAAGSSGTRTTAGGGGTGMHNPI